MKTEEQRMDSQTAIQDDLLAKLTLCSYSSSSSHHGDEGASGRREKQGVGFARESDEIRGVESGLEEKREWMSSARLWFHSAAPSRKPTSNPLMNEGEVELLGSAELQESCKFGDLGEAFPSFWTGQVSIGIGSLRCGSQPMTNLSCYMGVRKERRCWSRELHQRFLEALQILGGCRVATPKQIRELMRVDGLTTDEVKSHLQKYRLHKRKVQALSLQQSLQLDNTANAGKCLSCSPEGQLQLLIRSTSPASCESSMEDDHSQMVLDGSAIRSL
ncbi:hypothetical protein Droror1_Dr00009113 [Drosera rotundifolia]